MGSTASKATEPESCFTAENSILDEAISALDNATESAVMQAIEVLREELTVLIIAHRLTILQHCDIVVEPEAGKIKRTGTYEEIVSMEEVNRGFREATS